MARAVPVYMGGPGAPRHETELRVPAQDRAGIKPLLVSSVTAPAISTRPCDPGTVRMYAADRCSPHPRHRLAQRVAVQPVATIMRLAEASAVVRERAIRDFASSILLSGCDEGRVAVEPVTLGTAPAILAPLDATVAQTVSAGPEPVIETRRKHLTESDGHSFTSGHDGRTL